MQAVAEAECKKTTRKGGSEGKRSDEKNLCAH